MEDDISKFKDQYEEDWKRIMQDAQLGKIDRDFICLTMKNLNKINYKLLRKKRYDANNTNRLQRISGG